MHGETIKKKNVVLFASLFRPIRVIYFLCV